MDLKELTKAVGGRKARLAAYIAGKITFDELAIKLNDWLWLTNHTSGKLQRQIWHKCIELAKQKNNFKTWVLLYIESYFEMPKQMFFLTECLKFAKTWEEHFFIRYGFFHFRDSKDEATRRKAERYMEKIKVIFFEALSTFKKCIDVYDEPPVIYRHNNYTGLVHFPWEFKRLVLDKALDLAITSKQCEQIYKRTIGPSSYSDLEEQAAVKCLELAKTPAQYKLAYHCAWHFPKLRERAMVKYEQSAKTLRHWEWLVCYYEDKSKEQQAVKKCLQLAKTLNDWLYLSNFFGNWANNQYSQYQKLAINKYLELATTFKECYCMCRCFGSDLALVKALKLAKTPKEFVQLYDFEEHCGLPSRQQKEEILRKLGNFLD